MAGTSIGTMNAAVLVSIVKENKSRRGSAERLIDFCVKSKTSLTIEFGIYNISKVQKMIASSH